jgi:hypothetical protein
MNNTNVTNTVANHYSIKKSNNCIKVKFNKPLRSDVMKFWFDDFLNSVSKEKEQLNLLIDLRDIPTPSPDTLNYLKRASQFFHHTKGQKSAILHNSIIQGIIFEELANLSGIIDKQECFHADKSLNWEENINSWFNYNDSRQNS